MGTNLPHIVLQPLEGNVQYKTDDIVNVHFYQYTPDAIIVRNESPFKTYQDLVKAAKEGQDKITFAGSGTNSANHLAHTRLNRLMGTKTTYVPFKGTGDLVSSVLGGHVSAAMSYNTLALSQKNKMRMLAVASEKRLAAFPDVPTFKELGGDWVDGAYRGVGVPKSTPEDLRRRISEIFSEINRDPEFRQKMADGGFELIDVTYDKMAAFMAERTKAYLEVGQADGAREVMRGALRRRRLPQCGIHARHVRLYFPRFRQVVAEPTRRKNIQEAPALPPARRAHEASHQEPARFLGGRHVPRHRRHVRRHRVHLQARARRRAWGRVSSRSSSA